MRKSLISLFILSLFVNASNIYAQIDNFDCYNILIKKTNFNKSDNSFEYKLFFRERDSCYEVFRKKVIDYSSEVEFSYSYIDANNKYRCYIIYDQITGISKNIFFDEKYKVFYISDPYDLSALGDEPVKNSIDFKSKNITIKSNDQGKIGYYKVNIKRIEKKPIKSCQ